MSRYVTVQRKENVALVGICREPVNMMDLDLWQQLYDTLLTLERDKSIRGVIFHSTLQRRVFTAGNDLNELYPPKTTKERYIKFWRISNQFLAHLLKSPLVTIAAVKGACPAGGTGLAMACDYRLITTDGTMGLNEVSIGIPVPEYWIKLMSSIVGQGKTDKLTQFSKMINATEALKIGLVDQVANDQQDILELAQNVMQDLLKLPDSGREITKVQLRGDLSLRWFDAERLRKEAEDGFRMLSSPTVVREFEKVFSRLSKSKSKL